MELEFWYKRWRNRETGFHEEAVNPLLIRHWDGIDVSRSARVLVPLCGKSVDMVWLAGRGHRVLGVELSPVAVEAFFAEQGLDPRVRHLDGFEIWDAGDIRVFCGNLFDLTPDLLGTVGAVYDRAALIALPEPMRHTYVRHVESLLPAGMASMLLITLEYPQDEMSGPPFSVSEDEVRAHYGARWQMEILQSDEALDENPNLRDRGLTRLRQVAYRLVGDSGRVSK